MVPTVEKCFELMEKYAMLDNIRAHSIVVEKVASVIARGLLDAGENLSLEKVTAGALMHDIGKTLCLNSTDDHAAKGEEICLENHLDEIADIVGEHIRLKNHTSDKPISEKEIVYYADKRVNHDKVVSLEERLEYLLWRYGKKEKRAYRLIRKNLDLYKAVEKRLFARLDFDPDQLAGRLKSKDITLTGDGHVQ